MVQITSELKLADAVTISISDQMTLQTGHGRGLPFSGTTVTIDNFYAIKLLGRQLERFPSNELVNERYRVFIQGDGPSSDPRGKVIQVDDWRTSEDSDQARILKGLRAAADLHAIDIAIAFSDFDPHFGFVEALEVDSTEPEQKANATYRDKLLENARAYILGIRDFMSEQPQSSIRRISIVAQEADMAELLKEAAEGTFVRGEQSNPPDFGSLRYPKPMI